MEQGQQLCCPWVPDTQVRSKAVNKQTELGPEPSFPRIPHDCWLPCLQASTDFPVLPKSLHPPGHHPLPSPLALPACLAHLSPLPSLPPCTLCDMKVNPASPNLTPSPWESCSFPSLLRLANFSFAIQLCRLFIFSSPPFLGEFYPLKVSCKILSIHLMCPMIFWSVSVSRFIWVSHIYSSILLWCLILGLVPRSAWWRFAKGTFEWKGDCIPGPTDQQYF